MRQVLVDELLVIKQTFGDRRRTQIVSLKEGEQKATLLTTTDVTPAQTVWVAVTEDGTITYSPEETPLRQGGKDAPRWLVHTNTHHTLYLVSTQGRAAAVAVHALPEANKASEAVSIYKVSALPENDRLVAVFSLPPRVEIQSEGYVLTASRGGMIKKTAVSDLPGPSSQAFVLAKVNDGDELGWVRLSNGTSDLLLITALGMSICFSEEEVRSMGLVAVGVNSIKLGAGDELVGVEVLPKTGEALLLTVDGKAKRINLADFPRQGRYGQGVVAWKLGRGLRLVGVMVGKGTARGTVHFARAASRLLRLDEAPLRTRATAGQAMMEVKTGDRLVGLTAPWDGLSFWTEKPAASRGRKKAAPKETEVKD
jgi:DNA gyrase/topoisomerase IV subunit A